MSKHTPGPWTLNQQRGRGNSLGRLFVRARRDDYCAIAHVCQRVEREANARLIAEAPAMLELLREFVSRFDDFDRECVDRAKALLARIDA
jgi:hypothetical protein